MEALVLLLVEAAGIGWRSLLKSVAPAEESEVDRQTKALRAILGEYNLRLEVTPAARELIDARLLQAPDNASAEFRRQVCAPLAAKLQENLFQHGDLVMVDRDGDALAIYAGAS